MKSDVYFSRHDTPDNLLLHHRLLHQCLPVTVEKRKKIEIFTGNFFFKILISDVEKFWRSGLFGLKFFQIR